MKAALFYPGPEIRVEQVPDPKPGHGEVLVRVQAAGICGSDLHSFRNPKLQRLDQPPGIRGHELAGEVVSVGPGVEDLRVGQRVGVEPLIGCNQCQYCRTGDYHLCAKLAHIGNVFPGGFAEMSVAPRNKVFLLPDNVDMNAAGILDVYACAVHAAHRVPVTVADTVLVIGGGAIGLTAAEVARASGARRVFVMATQERALEAARQLRFDAAINPRQQDPVQAVMDLTGGKGADVTIEAVGGANNTLDIGMQATARGGTLGVLGSFGEPPTLTVNNGLRRELTLAWIWSYATWKGIPEFQIALDLLAEGRVDPKPFLTHFYSLDKIREGFDAALNKGASGAVKVVINP